MTRHEPLKRILADRRVSKDPRQHWPAWINGEIPRDWPLYSWVAYEDMFTAYGDNHKRLRGLVSKAFTARRVAALRPHIEQITTDLLDGIGTAAPGEAVDLHEAFAHKLPVQVICSLFGVPAEERDFLRRPADSVFNTSADREEVLKTLQELEDYLADLIAAKRVAPGDDLTSELIAARDDSDGSQLSEAELLGTLHLMLLAGYETTVNLIGNAIHALLTHPAQLELVRAGQSSWDDVTDETLRWAPSVAAVPLRYAVEDIDLDGVLIRQGEPILAGYAGAGRDPAQHGEDADRFDITRASRGTHLSFGHGIHYCIGAPLAKLEAGIALPALFTRFPDIELAVRPDQLEPIASFIANGYRALPVVTRPPVI